MLSWLKNYPAYLQITLLIRTTSHHSANQVHNFKHLTMKTLLLFVALLAATSNVYSQHSRVYYQHKSNRQHTIAWITLGGGIALTGIGALVATVNAGQILRFNTPNERASNTADILIYSGLGLAAVSIPFFISSSNNRKKAASVTFHYEYMPLPPGSPGFSPTAPTLTLKVGLR